MGAALPGIEIRLVDEHGREPRDEDGGEIHIRGANLFSGYWPDGADGPDAEGWWATGDVGYLDPTGDLYLVDRLKELVIVSGFNVYPSEVEDVIAELPGGRRGGRDRRRGRGDRRGGRRLRQADGRRGRATTSSTSYAGTAQDRLARFKQPSVIHVVDELPYTPTGKVQKGRLRATERRRALGLLE